MKALIRLLRCAALFIAACGVVLGIAVFLELTVGALLA